MVLKGRNLRWIPMDMGIPKGNYQKKFTGVGWVGFVSEFLRYRIVASRSKSRIVTLHVTN